MACPHNLFTSLTGSPDTGGCWYLVGVSGSYDGNLLISNNGVNWHNTTLGVNDKIQNIAQGVTGHDIWVDFNGETPSQLRFKYVTPCPPSNTYSTSWENDACYQISEITANKLPVVEDVEVEYCIEENGLNLFDDAGVLAADYDILGCTGGSDCSKFNLTNGNYNPGSDNIAVGSYVFVFKHKSSPTPCDNAMFELTVNLVEGPYAGEEYEIYICSAPQPV